MTNNNLYEYWGYCEGDEKSEDLLNYSHYS